MRIWHNKMQRVYRWPNELEHTFGLFGIVHAAFRTQYLLYIAHSKPLSTQFT